MLAEYSIVKHVKLAHLHIDCFFFSDLNIFDELLFIIFIQYSEKEFYETKLNEYDKLNYF